MATLITGNASSGTVYVESMILTFIKRILLFCSLILFTSAGSANEQPNIEKQQKALAGCNAINIGRQQSTALRGKDRELVDPVTAVPATTSRQYTYRVVAKFPHDPKAFTQGLVFYKGMLYESTGLLGESSIRKLDVTSGRVLQTYQLKENYFGEGLSVLNNRFVQLTWKSGVGFIYDPASLSPAETFEFSGEGWGSTTIDNQLVISDGSSLLKLFDPHDYRVAKTLRVKEQDNAVEGLNELEYVDGTIFANVWPTDCIARIDTDTGQVSGWLNLAALYPAEKRPQSTAVLNGIAHNTVNGHLFVTGKFWPYIYELEISGMKPDEKEPIDLIANNLAGSM